MSPNVLSETNVILFVRKHSQKGFVFVFKKKNNTFLTDGNSFTERIYKYFTEIAFHAIDIFLSDEKNEQKFERRQYVVT